MLASGVCRGCSKLSLDCLSFIYTSMSKKTKQLLDNLNKITASKKNPQRIWDNDRVYLPETNKFWKSQLTDGIHEWPKEYHKGPWNKVVDEDGTVDYWAPFDRVYGGLTPNSQRLVQKDGTEYRGKLYKKRRLIKSKNIIGEERNFYSQCLVTADGRWFDNGGFPINPPSKVEDEEQKEEVGFARRELTEEEKAEQLKWKQRAESEMLSKLK